MSNNTQLPYSVPTRLKGQKREEFQGGKAKVLELFNTLGLGDFLQELTKQILTNEAGKWFALDCAKFVLPVFQEQRPNDKRVRECIEVLESYLKGKSTQEQLSIAAAYAADAACCADAAADAARYAAAAVAAAAAADAARYAADAGYAAVHYAADAVHYAAYAARYAGYAADAAADASNNEMQGFVKKWIDQYFDTK